MKMQLARGSDGRQRIVPKGGRHWPLILLVNCLCRGQARGQVPPHRAGVAATHGTRCSRGADGVVGHTECFGNAFLIDGVTTTPSLPQRLLREIFFMQPSSVKGECCPKTLSKTRTAFYDHLSFRAQKFAPCTPAASETFFSTRDETLKPFAMKRSWARLFGGADQFASQQRAGNTSCPQLGVGAVFQVLSKETSADRGVHGASTR